MSHKLPESQIRKLAHDYQTPLYIFSEKEIREQCQKLKSAIPYENKQIRYACKALTLQAVLKIVRNEGINIDAVSMNEVIRAQRAGFSNDQILYTGEGANVSSFKSLLDQDILINCSSIDQIKLIGKLKRGVSCSIRVNPGKGHGETKKTDTGGPSSKHGIYFDQLDEVKKILKEHDLKLVGIHSHIGSGSKPKDWQKWITTIEKTLKIVINEFGDYDIDFVDIGGGLPVAYKEDEESMPLDDWGAKLSESFEKFSNEYGKNIQLQIEPGRFIVAGSGSLIAQVENVKHTPDYNFLIVNTGLNHNPRPSLYGSYHPISFIGWEERNMEGEQEYVIGGNLCESGDVFTVTEDGTLVPRNFPKVQVGDLMVMGMIGAYSYVMKSEYNSMNLPASVMVDSNGNERLIERRGTVDDIMLREMEATE